MSRNSGGLFPKWTSMLRELVGAVGWDHVDGWVMEPELRSEVTS